MFPFDLPKHLSIKKQNILKARFPNWLSNPVDLSEIPFLKNQLMHLILDLLLFLML